MTPERWQRLQEVFHGAAELDPLLQPAYLEAACEGDDALRREVEALLAARRYEEDLTAQIDEVASATLVAVALVGTRLGPYRVVREIGRGGMGRVYLAFRDDDQFQRRVAVKLADSAQAPDLLARFRSERQIVAALDHPNIARLLDGGTTEEGVPYLVLEYVEGDRIDRYCDLRQLGIGERLQLFRTVCAAVHYAHQNLVVHRDIKPSNVLVTADGTPKLLDFGIAKLLKPELRAQAPELTTMLHRRLTPDYASPEQIRGENVTTATDVYSLGVLLYELLTGCKPLAIGDGDIFTFERIVTETEPEPPSHAALRPSDGPNLPAPEQRSRDRGTTPERLCRRLQGDLDNVVMMALRKDPARRYASAEQLADDLLRASGGLPVRARKDTIRYRARKFVGRNRYAVATGLAFVALVMGFGVNRARLARDLAAERDRATQEAESARRVASFLADVFRLADPTELDGGSVTAREILDQASERLGKAADERPEVRTELLDTIGSIYEHLADYGRAEPLLQEALALRQHRLGEENLDTARSLLHLGELYTDQSRFTDGEDLLRRALRVREKLLGEHHPDVAQALYSLELVLRREGKSVEGEQVLRRAIALDESVSRDSPPVALALDRLAQVLEDQGRLEEAETAARRAVDIARRRLGEHVDTARCVGRLGSVLSEEGKYEEAEPLIREALDYRRDKLGPQHPTAAFWLEQLGSLLRDRGELDQAEHTYREALAGPAGARGGADFQLASIRANLAELLLEKGNVDEAQAFYTQSLDALDRLSHESLFVLASREGLARVAAARGDLAGAERSFREILEARRRSDAPPGLPIAGTLLGLGEVLLARDDVTAAEPLLREALALRLRALPAEHKDVGSARGALGECLLAERRYTEAEPLLVDAHAALHGRTGARHAAALLVRLYEAWGRPAKAEPYRALAARE